MPKDLESLAISRDIRAEIQTKYGFIPTSIMTAEKWKQVLDPEAEARNYYSQARITEDTPAKTIFDVSGQSVRDGALSRYPQNIGIFLVKMYSDEGDTVLDPFTGHNSRMELTFKLNRNYIGYDISHKFMEANQHIKDKLLGSEQGYLIQPSNFIKLVEGDACALSMAEEADMILTSPPYWDLEYYGGEKEQLGNCPTYDKFLIKLYTILKRCFIVLRQGRYCCWSVNDFRRDKIFYAYHSDLIELYLKAGFALHDIIIVDLGYPISAAFASQLEQQKRTAKRHEYVIVGKKV